MKRSKRIELTENTIKYLAKKAIDEGTSFKPYVESILDSLANTQVGSQSKDVKEKAMWWIANGETGMSSKTMWNCLIGNSNFPINHPYDPDDFSRCYKLLQAVPEWKNELYKLKPLSKSWNNLVENWDKLTGMFEENRRTDWKNAEKIGMYEFMQTLIRA